MMRLTLPLPSCRQSGFTLVEMIVVIVITGIIGGMVAVFIRAPMQGYVDSARRAEMTDIADTALRRITRDLRLALPNSISVTTTGGGRNAGGCTGMNTCFIEFLPTKGGGRYRVGTPGNILNFDAPDTSFDVIGAMPAFAAGDWVVVYNLGIAGASAYDVPPTNRTTWSSTAAPTVNIASFQFPFDSPAHRFQVISTPVTYVCDPVGGTLKRYWGYPIQSAQPNSTTVAPLSTASNAMLATNVTLCSFDYSPQVSAQYGLVTLSLKITESGESVTLYSAAHVNNIP